jgi:hypothetical protein
MYIVRTPKFNRKRLGSLHIILVMVHNPFATRNTQMYNGCILNAASKDPNTNTEDAVQAIH